MAKLASYKGKMELILDEKEHAAIGDIVNFKIVDKPGCFLLVEPGTKHKGSQVVSNRGAINEKSYPWWVYSLTPPFPKKFGAQVVETAFVDGKLVVNRPDVTRPIIAKRGTPRKKEAAPGFYRSERRQHIIPPNKLHILEQMSDVDAIKRVIQGFKTPVDQVNAMKELMGDLLVLNIDPKTGKLEFYMRYGG